MSKQMDVFDTVRNRDEAITLFMNPADGVIAICWYAEGARPFNERRVWTMYSVSKKTDMSALYRTCVRHFQYELKEMDGRSLFEDDRYDLIEEYMSGFKHIKLVE